MASADEFSSAGSFILKLWMKPVGRRSVVFEQASLGHTGSQKRETEKERERERRREEFRVRRSTLCA